MIICFVHPIFGYWSPMLTKLRKYENITIIFVYILQGQMGKTEKTEGNHTTKSDQNTKNQRRKYGMNESLVSA